MKEVYDPRARNSILPPQAVSPHCFFRTHTANQDKSDSSQVKVQAQSPQFNMAAKQSPVMVIDMNTNPYYQPQTKVDQLTAIDTKILQAQSQFGAVGAAAVAVAAHRN